MQTPNKMTLRGRDGSIANVNVTKMSRLEHTRSDLRKRKGCNKGQPFENARHNISQTSPTHKSLIGPSKFVQNPVHTNQICYLTKLNVPTRWNHRNKNLTFS